MAPDTLSDSTTDIGDQIIAIRDKWHTKNHPLFTTLLAGELDLRILGIHQANHLKYVELALESFAIMYTRGPISIRKMWVENMAEEEGLLAQDVVGEEPREHVDMLHNFCLAAGMSQDEIDNTRLTPAWWGRTLYHRHIASVEPVGVVLATYFTQEGQQPQLNNEVTIPALTSHYGFARDSDAIEFFVAHELADQEHSQRQLDRAVEFLDTPELQARALFVADQMCRLRWASVTDQYRLHRPGDGEFLPEGVVY